MPFTPKHLKTYHLIVAYENFDIVWKFVLSILFSSCFWVFLYWYFV